MGIVNVVCSNIITQDGKFLFVKETKEAAKDRFSLPAGRLEFGESLMECAVREAKEETGLEVRPVRLIGIYQRPCSSEDSNTTVFCFLSDIVSGETSTTEEHPEIAFMTLDEIKALESDQKIRSRYMLPAIEDHLNGKGIDPSFIWISK